MAAPSHPFSAVLLAGGRSSRMGSDKAALELDGQPLWQRQLTRLRATGAAELFISGPCHGAYAAAGVPIIEDLHPQQGPLGGLQASLRQARHDWLLVLAVDLPDVPAAFLARLAGEAVQTGVGQVPAHGDWLQPLAAVYPRTSLATIDACLADGRRALRHLVQLGENAGWLRRREISAAELSLFRNLNTPADLSAAQS